MGLRDRFSRSRKDPAADLPGAGDATPGAGGEEMPTLVQGAPLPGADGPDDQTFIASPQEFEAAGTVAGTGGGNVATAEPQPAGDPVQAHGEPQGEHAAPPAPPQPQAPARPGFRERGRLRRRLRYLREVRELGYRDLGGLVLDQHRFQRPNEELVEGKVEAIEALDREMRAIEQALNESTPYTELFIPGLSACPRCGALHGSDANFCPQCGLSFKGPRTVAGVGTADGAGVPDPGYQPPPASAPPGYPAASQPYAYPPAPQGEPVPPAPQPEPVPEAPQPAQETEIGPPAPQQPAE